MFNLFVMFKKTRFGAPKSTIQCGTLRFLWVISTHVARRYKETKLSRRAFQPTAGGSARFDRRRSTRSTNNTRGGIWCPMCFCQVLLPSDLSGWKKSDPWNRGFLVTWIFWVSLKGHLEAGVIFVGSFWNTTNYPRDPITLSDDDWGV